MRALLVNPQEGACVFGFQEARRLLGKKASGPPLGLITAAALLPAQWSLRLVDLAIRDLTENDWQWADIVMLSGNYLHRPSVLNLIQQCRDRRKPVVVGGPYASSLPEEIMDAGANFVVVGEGENTIPMLIEALSAGKTSGRFKNEHRPDLTTSPIPRFDLLDKDEYQHGQIQTSRGCPFNCEFCDIITLYGRAPRFKTPEQVIAELDALYRLGWKGPVFVADDNFIGNKKHAQETLGQMITWQRQRSEPFGFFTQASVNLGQDRELIDLMTAANFGNIFIGVESPDEGVLTLANKKQNVRNPLAESLDTINRNGLPVMASFVLGFDGEKPGVGERICALVEETAIPVAIIGTLWALPNTAMWHRMKQEGRLFEHVSTPMDFMGGTFNFVTSRPTREIINEYVGVWDHLYEPSRFLARAYRYYLSMRPTRKAMEQESTSPDPTPTDAPKVPQPFRETVATVRAFCILAWRLGVRSSCRMQFWRQLIGMLKKNPSRIRQYIVACAYGPDMFHVRDTLMAWQATAVESAESSKSGEPASLAR
jgi:radical SAM superfamily enzyme YgiQ (UPF0313 family)